MTARPAMGLIVLRVDETIEEEFRASLPVDLARLHVTRLDSGDDLTPESIAAMESGLTSAAALLPAAADFDVVAYACTSGTAFLGEANLRDLVMRGVPTRAVTNPLTAAVAQIEDLGLSRVGIVSPYVGSVAAGLCAAFAERGVPVVDTLSLDESEEAKVARIPSEVICDAARTLAARSALDGVFLSCTNLRTANILEPLSETLGMPVLSSNAALAWHMKRLCGLI